MPLGSEARGEAHAACLRIACRVHALSCSSREAFFYFETTGDSTWRKFASPDRAELKWERTHTRDMTARWRIISRRVRRWRWPEAHPLGSAEERYGLCSVECVGLQKRWKGFSARSAVCKSWKTGEVVRRFCEWPSCLQLPTPDARSGSDADTVSFLQVLHARVSKSQDAPKDAAHLDSSKVSEASSTAASGDSR